MFAFNKKYLLFTCLLLLVEVLIAMYVHDKIIRPYIGDVLVVILIYCFIKAFVKGGTIPVALGVLLFSYLIETMQYFKLVNLLELQKSRLANVVIGNSFSWVDIVAYTVGIAIIILVERLRKV